MVVVLSLVLQQMYSLQKFLGYTVSGSTKYAEVLHIKTLKHFLYIAENERILWISVLELQLC